MNVLCDFHHTDLFRSFRTLFENRLGMKLFRPIGEDWWEKGYYHHPEPVYGRGCLSKESFHRGHLRDYDSSGPSHYPHGSDWKEWSWITLAEASEKIDIIVSTHPANERAYAKFQKEARPRAERIRYIGNEGEEPSEISKNLLCSNLIAHQASKKKYHSLFFHPEFDTALYSWSEPPRWEKPVIRTFLNYIYHNAPQSDKPLYQKHRAALISKYYFFTHGLGTPPPGVDLPPGDPLWSYLLEKNGAGYRMPDLIRSDGEPETHEEISALMKQTNLAWHVKNADGYGYALHQLYACGRPVICRREDYRGKTGALLLQDKKTCVMLDGNERDDIRKIERFLEPDENARMCRRAHDRFRKVVNFEAEAVAVKKFLRGLKR